MGVVREVVLSLIGVEVLRGVLALEEPHLSEPEGLLCVRGECYGVARVWSRGLLMHRKYVKLPPTPAPRRAQERFIRRTLTFTLEVNVLVTPMGIKVRTVAHEVGAGKPAHINVYVEGYLGRWRTGKLLLAEGKRAVTANVVLLYSHDPVELKYLEEMSKDAAVCAGPWTLLFTVSALRGVDLKSFSFMVDLSGATMKRRNEGAGGLGAQPLHIRASAGFYLPHSPPLGRGATTRPA